MPSKPLVVSGIVCAAIVAGAFALYSAGPSPSSPSSTAIASAPPKPATSDPLSQARTASESQPPVSVARRPFTPPALDKSAYDKLPAGLSGYVTCVRHGLAGQVWAGSEGNGVGVYDPKTQTWRRFTTQDGLGDNDVYAVAIDRQGRTWVGHGSRGVSVFNGQIWTNFDATRGPLSQRIFAISVSPTDGDVWIAGDCGLTRYRVDQDRWTDITRLDGLPSDQCNAIAFDPAGNVFVATQADGIATASRASDFKSWTHIDGPPDMPDTVTGEGLPSCLIDDLVADQKGDLYASTPYGLAIYRSADKKWTFVRGQNWHDNVQGLMDPPVESDAAGPIATPPLTEDRCTALALDEAGRLFVGHWHGGVDVLDPARLPDASARIATLPGPTPIGTVQPLLSAGLAVLGSPKGRAMPELVSARPLPNAIAVADVDEPSAAVPTPAAPPDPARLADLAKTASAWPATTVPAEYLSDDWATMGNWPGRVGSRFTGLFGFAYPAHGLGDPQGFTMNVTVGPHIAPGGATGCYTYVTQHQNDRTVLYTPGQKDRYAGEINDGSWQRELYPESWEGPDIGIGIAIPAGVHRVSLYFVNVDRTNEPLRDFFVELKRAPLKSFTEARSTPTLVGARVKHFNNGVYKQFLLREPGQYWFNIRRNGSFCTKVSAIFVDDLSPAGSAGPDANNTAPATRPSTTASSAWPTEFMPPTISESPRNTSPAAMVARNLWTTLDRLYDRQNAAAAHKPYRLLAYRAALAANAGDDLLANWRQALGLWTDTDRTDFGRPVAANQPPATP